MRVIVLILLMPIVVLLGRTTAIAQSASTLSGYVCLFSETAQVASSFDADLQKFASHLERKKQSKSDREFLEYLFAKTHQRYLRHYTEYAAFDALAKNGTYNCLTGTALYAMLLDHFNFKYRIIETNYHIFLLANTGDGDVLFEATDPARGFVSDPEAITRRVTLYKENSITQAASSEKTLYHYPFSLYNEVSLNQVVGLLQYNKAIAAYNNHQPGLAINYLGKAITVYNSPRIEAFSKIILLSVMHSELEASIKEACVKKIQLLRKQRMPAIASSSSIR